MVASKRVLLLAHTLLSMRYVAAVAALLAGDPRLRLVWTLAPDDYGTGTVWKLLSNPAVAGRQVPAVTLRAAAAQPWDMVLLGTHGYSAPFRECTRVLVAHGLGGGKLVAAPEIGIVAPEEYTYGPGWALEDGAPKYRLMLEASHTVRARAVGRCPPLAPVIQVVGSLEADRLLASRGHREGYRAALGLTPDQTAVLLISTFGRDSLLARHGTGLLDAATRLTAEGVVPLLTCHPHVWAGRADGRADGTSGGLDGGWPPRLARLAQTGQAVVCPPGADWIPYLVAADVAVIDHGSLGLYWSLLERPTITVPVRAGRVDPVSPIVALHAATPRLTNPAALGEIVQKAQDHPGLAGFAPWRTELIAYPGEAAVQTRQALYDLLDLPVPEQPLLFPAPPSTHTRAWQDATLPAVTVSSTSLEPS